MFTRQFVCLGLFAGTVCSTAGGALAQEAAGKPQMPLVKTIGRPTPTGPVPSLAVLNSAGAKLEGGKLTLVSALLLNDGMCEARSRRTPPRQNARCRGVGPDGPWPA